MTRPSWVSYGAQASLAGRVAHFVPGSGGVPDAGKLARTVAAARAAGRPVRAVIVTLPDNPTGSLAPAAAVRALCSVAERHDLIIISDEIYRDLVHDDETEFTSPAAISAERTVVTTGLSKNLALGGWRLGVARLPDGRLGRELRARLVGIGSEIWSAPAGPVQQAAALAFGEPPPLAERIALSRRLHARGGPARSRSGSPRPARPCRRRRRRSTSTRTSPRSRTCCSGGTASPATRAWPRCSCGGTAWACCRAARSASERWRLRLRVATSMLYGEGDDERHAALNAADPCALPWIAAALDRLEEILADLTVLSRVGQPARGGPPARHRLGEDAVRRAATAASLQSRPLPWRAVARASHPGRGPGS